jgi:chemotaxis signal transduction protein
MLTLLDPLEILNLSNGDNSEPAFIIALRGDEQLALAAERAEKILEIFVDEITPSSDEGNERSLHGVITIDGSVVLILKPDELFNSSALRSVRRRGRR